MSVSHGCGHQNSEPVAPVPPVSRGALLALLLLLSAMSAAIAGLVTALLRAGGMGIVTASGATFASVFAMAMAAFHFLTRR